MIKKLFAIIFIFSLLSNNVIAIEADIFVQSTVNRASKLLSENISKEEKIKKLELIAKDTVDIKGIGFYTLGSARKNLNDLEKKKYSELF
jgi:phospholipid transport system substrate-binding protein